MRGVIGLKIDMMFPDGVSGEVDLEIALVDGDLVGVAEDGGDFFQR